MSNEETEEGKVASTSALISGFFKEVGAEFNKTTWPRGRELTESTAVVLAFIAILSVTVFCFDKIAQWAIGLLH